MIEKTQENKSAPGKGEVKKNFSWFKNRSIHYSNIASNLINARIRLRKANSLGKLVQLIGKPAISNRNGQLIIGDKVIIESKVAKTEIAVSQGATLEIGERTYINYGCSIGSTVLVKIGKGCRIGNGSIIIDNDYHGIEDRRNPPPPEPIVLEDNVWLAARVIVLKGVTIGHDSVIGAGSVVTKNIPPRCLAAGMPAKVIRTF